MGEAPKTGIVGEGVSDVDGNFDNDVGTWDWYLGCDWEAFTGESGPGARATKALE